MRKKSFI